MPYKLRRKLWKHFTIVDKGFPRGFFPVYPQWLPNKRIENCLHLHRLLVLRAWEIIKLAYIEKRFLLQKLLANFSWENTQIFPDFLFATPQNSL